MKCIFPCLQLIYFYIGVEYIVLCYFFFPLLWGVEIGEISVALRMPCWDGPRKREHRQRQKDLIFNRRRLTFSKKVISLFKNYFKCSFLQILFFNLCIMRHQHKADPIGLLLQVKSESTIFRLYLCVMSVLASL